MDDNIFNMTYPRPHCSCEMTDTFFWVDCCFPHIDICSPTSLLLPPARRSLSYPVAELPHPLAASVESWCPLSWFLLRIIQHKVSPPSLNEMSLSSSVECSFCCSYLNKSHFLDVMAPWDRPEWNPWARAPLLFFSTFGVFVHILLECAFTLNDHPCLVVCTHPTA